MISIIVPVYNAAPYITQTIDMVRQQTYEDWELLLVNDCSKDASKTTIELYLSKLQDTRIRFIENEENIGAARTRNHGLDEAKGRYIAFLDADDVWFPQKLETQMNLLKKKQVGFLFSAYEFGDEEARGTGRIVHVPDVLTYKKALSRTIIFTTTVLFDTEIIPKELIYMPNVASEDTATWWQILRAGYKAYGLDEVLAIYRRPAKSLSSNKFLAMKRIWNLYREREHLNVLASAWYFCFWALRATLRRV